MNGILGAFALAWFFRTMWRLFLAAVKLPFLPLIIVWKLFFGGKKQYVVVKK